MKNFTTKDTKITKRKLSYSSFVLFVPFVVINSDDLRFLIQQSDRLRH